MLPIILGVKMLNPAEKKFLDVSRLQPELICIFAAPSHLHSQSAHEVQLKSNLSP